MMDFAGRQIELIEKNLWKKVTWRDFINQKDVDGYIHGARLINGRFYYEICIHRNPKQKFNYATHNTTWFTIEPRNFIKLSKSTLPVGKGKSRKKTIEKIVHEQKSRRRR